MNQIIFYIIEKRLKLLFNLQEKLKFECWILILYIFLLFKTVRKKILLVKNVEKTK